MKYIPAATIIEAFSIWEDDFEIYEDNYHINPFDGDNWYSPLSVQCSSPYFGKVNTN